MLIRHHSNQHYHSKSYLLFYLINELLCITTCLLALSRPFSCFRGVTKKDDSSDVVVKYVNLYCCCFRLRPVHNQPDFSLSIVLK